MSEQDDSGTPQTPSQPYGYSVCRYCGKKFRGNNAHRQIGKHKWAAHAEKFGGRRP